MKEKILILGSSGLAGKYMANFLKENKISFFSHSNLSDDSDFKCDLSFKKDIDKMLSNINPDVILNLVALTDVDLCERKLNLAYKINTETVQNLVSSLSNLDSCHLIHVSSDQLYDDPFLNSEDQIKLQNNYSLTKYLGESVCTVTNSTILRTNFFGKSFAFNRKSFSDWIIHNLKRKNQIKVFEDVYFNPLHLETFCECILKVIKLKKEGVYNLGSKKPISKAEFSFLISEHLELKDKYLNLASVRDLNLDAYRPKNMSMDCSKFEKAFNINLPNLTDEIKKLS
jgi:dTDP-4-dehydrorhamnose reductase